MARADLYNDTLLIDTEDGRLFEFHIVPSSYTPIQVRDLSERLEGESEEKEEVEELRTQHTVLQEEHDELQDILRDADEALTDAMEKLDEVLTIPRLPKAAKEILTALLKHIEEAEEKLPEHLR